MSIIKKNTKTLQKTRLKDDVTGITGAKAITAAHIMAGGETSIDLTNLTLPPELTGTAFVQPSTSDLLSCNIFFYSGNVRLISSSKGVLMQHLSYRIISSSVISLSFAADVGEIFFVEIMPKAFGATAVDGRSDTISGLLTAGNTVINVFPYEVNKYPDQQQGALLVFVNGELQMRNVGNAAAAPSADGNYHEKNQTQIELNTSFSEDVGYVVVSNGLMVERPDFSMMAHIESVHSAVTAVSNFLVNELDADPALFSTNPSNVDLRAFGDMVNALAITRTAYGAVTPDASPSIYNTGSNDFTIVRVSYGYFYIQFNTAFSAVPLLIINGNYISTTRYNIPIVDVGSSTTTRVYFYVYYIDASGNPSLSDSNSPMSFMCIGRR